MSACVRWCKIINTHHIKTLNECSKKKLRMENYWFHCIGLFLNFLSFIMHDIHLQLWDEKKTEHQQQNQHFVPNWIKLDKSNSITLNKCSREKHTLVRDRRVYRYLSRWRYTFRYVKNDIHLHRSVNSKWIYVIYICVFVCACRCQLRCLTKRTTNSHIQLILGTTKSPSYHT